MKRKQLLATLLAAAFAVTAVGCGGEETSSSSSVASTSSGGTSSTSSETAEEAPEIAGGGPVVTHVDGYPSRNIQVIHAFGPGDPTESYLRQMLAYIEKDLGFEYKFTVVNKEGGSGLIGWTAIATAEPDGYTLGYLPSPMLQNPVTMGDECEYTKDSFDFIGNMVTDPGCIAVAADSPYQTLQEMVTDAQDPNVTISIGTTGLTTSEARAVTQIQKATGATFRVIPYNSPAEATASVRGGHIDAFCMNVSDAYTEISEGSVRLLAVGTEERASKFPDVPTYQECGYDVIQYSMRAFGGPKGIPEDILQMLRQSYARAQADPEVQAYADNLGMFVDPKSPQQIQEAWDALDADMRALWETDPWQ